LAILDHGPPAALAVNLVSEVVPAADLMPRATEVASMITAQSPTAVRGPAHLCAA
jgi:enoyl-CoA hydratase/carnithine racemase